jgi:hypothetical protein
MVAAKELGIKYHALRIPGACQGRAASPLSDDLTNINLEGQHNYMADALTGLNDFLGNLQLDFANPIGMATNLILSTIVGGIVILIVAEILSKKFSQDVNPLHAFMLALSVNIINIPIVMGLLYSVLSYIPLMGLVAGFLPLIIWIVLTKLFFRDMSILPVLIIAVLGYGLTMFLVPMLVNIVAGFIPI